MSEDSGPAAPDRRRMVFLLLSRVVPGFIVVAALIFLPAGSLAWVNGWVYIGALSVLIAGALSYFLARDPALLERRMRMRERRSTQKFCVAASYPVIVAVFALPGLDHRFGWSRVPAAVVIVGLAAVLAGYALFFAVMRANSYASRVIEIQEGQRVIDTGPYAMVRHPLYVSSLVIYLVSPLVLGSWWAVIPALAYLPLLVARIRDEEALLRRDLPGYLDYCDRVKWRLLPGVW